MAEEGMTWAKRDDGLLNQNTDEDEEDEGGGVEVEAGGVVDVGLVLEVDVEVDSVELLVGVEGFEIRVDMPLIMLAMTTLMEAKNSENEFVDEEEVEEEEASAAFDVG